MPGLVPEVACHQLIVDPTARAVVQRRQSPEKAEAGEPNTVITVSTAPTHEDLE